MKILRVSAVLAIVLLVLSLVSCQGQSKCVFRFYNNGNFLYSIEAEQGDDVTLPFNQLQWNGYKFKGWECDGQLFSEGQVVQAHNDMEFVAVWQQVFSVTFTTKDGAEQFVMEEVEAGSTLTLPQCPFHGEGDFVAWQFEGQDFKAGDLFVMPSCNVTFVASWQVEESVTAFFLSDGLFLTIVSQEGQFITLPEAPVGNEGLVFVGWLKDDVLYQAGQLFEMSDGDVTFVAQWKEVIPTFTVNFFVKGQLVYSETVMKGDCVKAPTDPNDDDCVFVGWRDSNGNVFDFTEGVTSDIDLYARFAFVVTFDIGDAVGTVPDSIYSEGDFLLDVPLNFNKRLHTFIGWTDGENIYNNGDIVQCSANITLTALWEKTQVLVSLYVGGELWQEVECNLGNCTLPTDIPNFSDGRGELTFHQWINFETGEPFDGVCYTDQRFDGEFLPFVTFHSEVDTKLPEGFFVKAYQYFELPQPEADTTTDGWKFVGWQLDGVIYQPFDKVSVRYNSTVTAIWEKSELLVQIAESNLTVINMSCIIEPSVSGVLLCLTVKERLLIGNAPPRC